jgi:hypothetical protein
VEFGHDDLGCGSTRLSVFVHRDTSAVVRHGDGVVCVDYDRNTITETRLRLVDGVINNFPHHVVKTRDVVNITDVHAGALADSLEAFKNFDALGGIPLTHTKILLCVVSCLESLIS